MVNGKSAGLKIYPKCMHMESKRTANLPEREKMEKQRKEQKPKERTAQAAPERVKEEWNQMKLEELIRERFIRSESLVKQIASFNGLPAVFSPESPDDEHIGWQGNSQYPKVVYNFDLQANEERHSAGTLSVSLLCQNTAEVTPEAIEPLVRDCLRDVILKPGGGNPYCFAWARTDAFTVDEENNSLTIGSEIRFDILEYPSQETTDPDPIMGANKYLKELYPECLVMGYDRMEEITESTEQRPVIYCRLASMEKAQETNTVAWMDGKIAVHILCPSAEIRMKFVAGIAERMSLDGEIILLDGSPMFIKGLTANYRADYLKEGQILFTGHYGILRYQAKQPRILQGKLNYE